MQEFPLIGDRITILRDGVKINTVGINDCTNEELVNMMVGRSVEQVYARTENRHEGITLKAENLCDYHGRVRNVSFTVKKGEIVGLAAVLSVLYVPLCSELGLSLGATPLLIAAAATIGDTGSPRRKRPRSPGCVFKEPWGKGADLRRNRRRRQDSSGSGRRPAYAAVVRGHSHDACNQCLVRAMALICLCKGAVEENVRLYGRCAQQGQGYPADSGSSAGFKTAIPREEFFRIVNENGLALIGQSGNLVPGPRAPGRFRLQWPGLRFLCLPVCHLQSFPPQTGDRVR